MKPPLCSIATLGLMLCIDATFAGNAQWDLNPTSCDCNTATNGTPATVPNGVTHTAIFANEGASAGEGGNTLFFDSSSAANATFTNDGGLADNAGSGVTQFHDTSTAANRTFTNIGGTASGAFGGSTQFYGVSTADNATLIANGGMGGGRGGTIFFFGESTGGTSRIEVFSNGKLDISGHDVSRLTVGSIEGDGN